MPIREVCSWVAISTLACGCAAHRDVPTIEEAAARVAGAWTMVEPAGRGQTVAGELIAVEPESLYVLTNAGLMRFSTGELRRVHVVIHRGRGGVRVVHAGRLTRGLEVSGVKRIGRFARFPAGLPPGLDAVTLRPQNREPR